MSHTLTEVAQQLQGSAKKVQLIYAFNGTGKTRLSRAFKQLVAPKQGDEHSEVNAETEAELSPLKILYYNAFTEDLFYWDNDLTQDKQPKLSIQPNTFTNWILKEQGQEGNITRHFQRLTSDKLTPHFHDDFSAVSFSFTRGNNEPEDNIKISKGEESCFVWSVFYALLDVVVETLNVPDNTERDTQQFNGLQYVFIDDPVSSLDENHLIDMALRLANLIKRSESEQLKFIITTHNPLFYNVLHNVLNRAGRYVLNKKEDGTLDLVAQKTDSPFAYHLQLKAALQQAVTTKQIQKYHFNFLRNILEKTATFFGAKKWSDLLPALSQERDNPYARIINLHSHSEHAGEEIAEIPENHKKVLMFLVSQLDELYQSRMRSE